jgi:O-antigen/teichoic acid export membrane protein
MIVSITRLLNRGLLLISPLILARLLTVADFGRYREFLLYVTVLTGIAAFGISSSLLRFVPRDPLSGWRFVNQSIVLTLIGSTLVGAMTLVLNTIFDGALVGEYALPAVLYTWMFVNFDFWEALWLAERRPFSMWGYTTGRLVARIAVVTVAAALTRDVNSIIWSLIGLETVRVLFAIHGWYGRNRVAPKGGTGSWAELLRFCVPFGFALILATLTKSLGGLFIAKMLGPVALAHYAIGSYVQPVVTVLRNSVSDVLLGEMAARPRDDKASVLALFRRSTVVAFILLISSGVLLARFADTIVTTLFSEAYRPAVPIFQLYVLALLRESFDFSVALRTLDKTAPMLRSNLLALVLNAGLMLLMVPRWGLIGAVGAFVIARLVEGIYLAYQTLHAYEIGLRDLADWTDLLKSTAAAAGAAVVLYGGFWTDSFGLAGVVVASAVYLFAFGLLLRLAGVPQVAMLLRHAQGYSRALLARFQA